MNPGAIRISTHIHNVGDCGKCGIILTSFLSNPKYCPRGIQLTDDPKKSNLLIITGCLTKTQVEPLLKYWKEMPRNHRIISFGNCGTEEQDLFTFGNEQNLINQAIPILELSEILPIDFIIEGCPPTLEDISAAFKKLND